MMKLPFNKNITEVNDYLYNFATNEMINEKN